MNKETSTTIACQYCGDPCLSDHVVIKANHYCCYGCATLDEVVSKINTSEEEVQVQYKQFDLEDNFDQLVEFQNDKVYKVQISLPAIHCSSCVELLEDLPAFNKNVLKATVNFEQKACTVIAKKDLALSFLAQLLDDLGYPPQLSVGIKRRELEKKLQKETLFKMAVAGFCFGNIMLYSMPHYFGLNISNDPFFSKLFLGLSLFMSIPVLFYSGKEYLISAYKALTASRMHINIPIAIGILSLWAWSIYEIVSGSGSGYLDSLAGLIFFLLVGKWFQSRIYNEVSFQREVAEFIPMVVRKLVDNNRTKWTAIKDLQQGDHIEIKHGEIIPIDAYTMEQSTSVDYSFITGEQYPEEVSKRSKIFAGGRQLGGRLRLEVLEKPNMDAIWSNWNVNHQSDSGSTWTDHIARYFTAAVLTIAVAAGVIWYLIDPSRIPFVFSAVLIVACPCALALSAPFTYGSILRVFSKNNFFVKTANSIQQLGESELVVYDKTGTLSYSTQKQVSYVGEELSEVEMQILRSAVEQSTHPVSNSIAQSLYSATLLLDSFNEEIGSGLAATYKDFSLKLGSANWLKQEESETSGSTYLEINGQLKGKYVIVPEYRNDLELTTTGNDYKQVVLSGDNSSEEQALYKLYPGFTEMHFNLSPLDKKKKIEQYQKNDKVVMLGDGLNDAVALEESNFGIALTESLNGFYPNANGVLLASEFRLFPKFMNLARYSSKVLKVGLIFSLLYNIIGLAFAVTGLLTPIVAAILMPLSSVTVVSLDTALVRRKAIKLGLK
ncbi:MAG: heavy metal translocating P-type ATPase [Bacteroidia bacterium]